jgi:hypothetical protein
MYHILRSLTSLFRYDYETPPAVGLSLSDFRLMQCANSDSAKQRPQVLLNGDEKPGHCRLLRRLLPMPRGPGWLRVLRPGG